MFFYDGYWYGRMKIGKALNGRCLNELASFFYSRASRSGLQTFRWPLDISMFIWILQPRNSVLFFHGAAREPTTIKPDSSFYPSRLWSNPPIWGPDWLKGQQTNGESEEWIKGLMRKRLSAASWHSPSQGPVIVWPLLNMALIAFQKSANPMF